MATKKVTIPVAPKPVKTATPAPKSTSSSSSHSSSSSKSTPAAKPKASSSSSDPYAKYVAQQKADAKKASKKEANKDLAAAKSLQGQINALKRATGKYDNARDKALGNIDLVESQTRAMLMGEYEDRYGQLVGSSEDNEKAANDVSFDNLAERGIERRAALTEAMSQGAGESDLLRAQGMSLRAYAANQSDTNRSYFDTLRSINSSLTDLNSDTRTALVNNEQQAESDRGTAWNNYYDQMGQAYTDLGNALGQQAADYASAIQATNKKKIVTPAKKAVVAQPKSIGNVKIGAGKVPAKPTGKTFTTNPGKAPTTLHAVIPRQAAVPDKPAQKAVTLGGALKNATQGSADAFKKAANQTGKGYVSDGVSASTLGWAGHADFESVINNTGFESAATDIAEKKPEGATLRKWVP